MRPLVVHHSGTSWDTTGSHEWSGSGTGLLGEDVTLYQKRTASYLIKM